jgi:hypothetical protein
MATPEEDKNTTKLLVISALKRVTHYSRNFLIRFLQGSILVI